MSGPARIRTARADEWALLAPIEQASGTIFRHSAAPELERDATVPDEAAQRYTSQGRVLFAIDPHRADDHVIGFVAWHAEADPTCLGVAQISVHPDFGRQGVGTVLMRQVIETAISRGFRAITLNTQRNVPWNEPWYRTFGFVSVEPDDWAPWMAKVARAQAAEGLDWSTRTWMRLDIEILHGGVANVGAVARAGSLVSRPTSPHSSTIHRFLRHVRMRGFHGASAPVALLGDREHLAFISGDVALPPYPPWSQSDEVLASIARLLRRLHDASVDFRWEEGTWSDEMAEPAPAALSSTAADIVVGHNDVCLENVVFRDGVAVALLDFDFAAPVRRVWDLAMFARMCVPIDDPWNAERLGWRPSDLPGRLDLICDAYGLGSGDRLQMLACLDESIARGGEFVLRHVEAGEQGFIDMWSAMGGMERFDRRRTWWADAREEFAKRW